MMTTAILFRREITQSRLINNILGMAIFIVLTSLGAFVRIPLGFSPVPLTLQTFFVLLSGAVLGPNLGLLSQGGYIFLGALGLPIFTRASSGFFYLFGPTAGYLWGFVLASFITGNLVKHHPLRAFNKTGDLNFWTIFIYMIIGDAILLTSGGLWLFAALKFNLWQAIFLGVLPFIPGDIIKAIAAAHLYRKIQARTREIFS
ncbi:MAG: biotin transporter BioY [Candidatus Omnitrophota bacterium]